MYSICSLQFSSPVPGAPQAGTRVDILHAALGAPWGASLQRPVQQTLTTAGLVHMQITWAAFQQVVFAVHTLWSWYIHPELECTGALAILIRTNRKYVNSAWLRFFFFPQKKQKVILVQKVPCFGGSEHAGCVLRNKPAMILYLGEYLKAQSGTILQIS